MVFEASLDYVSTTGKQTLLDSHETAYITCNVMHLQRHASVIYNQIYLRPSWVLTLDHNQFVVIMSSPVGVNHKASIMSGEAAIAQ